MNWIVLSKQIKWEGYFYFIGMSISGISSFGINSFVQMQYSVYCSVIRWRYVAVHKYLKNILNNKKVSNGKDRSSLILFIPHAYAPAHALTTCKVFMIFALDDIRAIVVLAE